MATCHEARSTRFQLGIVSVVSSQRVRGLTSRMLYAAFRLLPRRSVVLFWSFDGRMSDSPKYLYMSFVNCPPPGLEAIWLLEEPERAPIETGYVHVGTRIGRLKAIYYMATAHTWVTNNTAPYRPRATTRYIQTWHGSPLKRIGLDIAGTWTDDRTVSRWVQDAQQWDLLLATDETEADRLRSAFHVPPSTQVLTVDLPRRDVLSDPDLWAAALVRVKDTLNLRGDKIIVLYAPTTRGAGRDSSIDQLNFDLLRKGLDDRFVFLLRWHPGLRRHSRGKESGQIVDVSGYDDVMELVVAADILVTDYSSLIFEFRRIAKPVILYPHDLQTYTADTGFYCAYDGALGNLVGSQQELIEAIRSTRLEHRSPVWSRDSAARAVLEAAHLRGTSPV